MSLIGWLGRGLWGLTALLALTAAGLAVGPLRAPAGGPLAPCTPGTAPASDSAIVHVRAHDRPRAQVRIDMHVLDASAGASCRIAPGTHDLAWRSSPDTPWQPAGAQPLAPHEVHLLRVGEDGLAISAYDP